MKEAVNDYFRTMATPARQLTAQMAALKQSWRRADRLIDGLCAEAEAHARNAARARSALAAARASHDHRRHTGDVMRLEQQLVDSIHAAVARLSGHAGNDPSATLRLSLQDLEELAPRIRGDVPLAAFAAATGALCDRVGRAWTAWLDGPTGTTLLEGARALALAPPGSLSLGVDGLEDEHAAREVAYPGLTLT
jgi:hypothetical protein